MFSLRGLTLTNHVFDENGYWEKPIPDFVASSCAVDLFDQNGYDLTELEQRFADENLPASAHRYRMAIKKAWFVQEHKTTGAVLNHSLLFERKAYRGAAEQQLQAWARDNNLIYKLLAMRPKWGLDFSMDWVDAAGNAFEILHWEYDGFDYEEIQTKKLLIQARFATLDWEDAGQQLLKKKDQWHHLDFFAQSDWKCRYFGIESERFKMVIWE